MKDFYLPRMKKIFYHEEKNFAFKGCFKCWICGSRLSLKTYHNNRNDTQDLEVII